MEKEFDIEFTNEESENEAGKVQLPLNFLSFGEIEPDDVKVYIKQDVYKKLEKYALEDTTKERGTILIGDYCEDLGKIHVVISDYIEAKYTDASASTLTFTHETWEYVHKKQDELYPDKRIIGWQHTHPSYGIFLSNYDLFIQDNFFNMPFQVAYVIDPIQNLRGFFQWKNGKTEKLKGYYIYDEVGKPIKIEQKKAEKPQAEKKGASKILTVFALFFAVLTLTFGFIALHLNGKYREQLKLQESAAAQLQKQQKTIGEQEQTIQEQKESINGLQTQKINEILEGSGTITVQDLIDRIENDELQLENKEAVLQQLKAVAAAFSNQKGEKPVRFKVHTVKVGDTLMKICEDNQLDYQAMKNIIVSLNGIENPDSIFVGQALLLPIQ